jgi:hypothetical protein
MEQKAFEIGYYIFFVNFKFKMEDYVKEARR